MIHAGKTVDKKALEKRFLDYDLGNMPTGVIMGKVVVTDCIKVTPEFVKTLNRESGNVYPKSLNDAEYYAWKVEAPEEFNEKISINGKLSLWNYNA